MQQSTPAKYYITITATGLCRVSLIVQRGPNWLQCSRLFIGWQMLLTAEHKQKTRYRGDAKSLTDCQSATDRPLNPADQKGDAITA
jgi:hypothetical protein